MLHLLVALALIAGRDGTPTYRADVPKQWHRIDPAHPEPDTTKPIVSFQIDSDLTLHVHSFPNLRLPPQAQVARWQRQTPGHVTPQTRGGFAGLFYEAATVLAWSFILDPEHDQTLRLLEVPNHRQMRADYTIKASGTQEAIATHRAAICAFANTFELIDEIPRRP